jgi:sortase (surface protein transpeptidase)
MNDGVKKEFKVEYTATVDPSQTYIIDNTKDTRITLYTCTGFLDSKRFVVVAFPTS